MIRNNFARDILKLVNFLIEERSVGEISDFMEVSERTVYRHLDVIHKAGFEVLIRNSGGRNVRYVLGKDRVPEFVKYLSR